MRRNAKPWVMIGLIALLFPWVGGCVSAALTEVFFLIGPLLL